MSPTSPAPLELQNVTCVFGDGPRRVVALEDVSLIVEPGELVAVMGPSGSGKSTLMNIIGCLDQATSGRVLLDGIDISRAGDNDLADIRLKKIGFIFQNFQLLSYATALDNVALPLVYANVPAKERRDRAAEMLKKVGLEDRMSFLPNQLSGGQKQRVAIARAMINKPRILLADEPTGALDSASGQQVISLFRALNDEGMSILMITHDPNVAANAHRKVEISDGRLYDGQSRVPAKETEVKA